jgi:3-dehydroquinate synthase
VDDFSQKLAEFSETTAYVIDKNVYELYKDSFVQLPEERIYFMEAVESEKNMDTVMKLITFMQELGVRKNWKVVCFGGGITQDVTTIASNLFLRNVDWYFFPTTLLSMCDSCIGGKCGINYRHIKNQIGVFYPPKKIFIDVRFLNTLTKGDYINGWGELLKFSLTSDEKFYDDLKKEKQYIPCERIAEYIHRGLYEKKKVIEADEFESDLRRVLNYGHTFGHALEAYTNNRIPHGTAVIWGIDVVNYIAVKEGLISEAYYLDIKELIKRAFIEAEMVVEEPDKLFNIIKTDKKVKGNTISLAVLDKPSNLVVYPMAIDEKLFDLFKQYLESTHEYYSH